MHAVHVHALGAAGWPLHSATEEQQWRLGDRISWRVNSTLAAHTLSSSICCGRMHGPRARKMSTAQTLSTAFLLWISVHAAGIEERLRQRQAQLQPMLGKEPPRFQTRMEAPRVLQMVRGGKGHA